jgi:hypothetical protein
MSGSQQAETARIRMNARHAATIVQSSLVWRLKNGPHWFENNYDENEFEVPGVCRSTGSNHHKRDKMKTG